MYKLTLIVACATLAAFAADPAGFNMWSASQLKGFEKSLTPKIKDHIATQSLSNYGNHFTMVAVRNGNGQAELHEKVSDLFVAATGEATLVVGGTMPGAKTTAPGEKRAASIEGGEKHKLGPGDIVHIPANTPHQLLVENGKQFTYFTLKVESK